MKLIKTTFLVLSLIFLSNYAFADEQCAKINTYGKAISNQMYLDICRDGYSIGYNTQTKTPAWVAEKLTREALDGKSTTRTNNFRQDPLIPEQYSATLEDYRGSGFDRGHMAPAEDFRNSETQMSDSFYLSNMIPQNSGLNRGTWAVLEKNMRYWAQKYGEIYIVTGPIYYQGKSLGYAGKVPVPTHVYKAIYIPKINSSVSFILPNQQVDVKQIPKSISTVKNLELLTGINFFPKIPDSVKSIYPEDLLVFNK